MNVPNTSLRIGILLILLFSPFASSFGQPVRITIGGKLWISSWDVPLPSNIGGSYTEITTAVLAGPFLSIRTQSFTGTVFYSTSAVASTTTGVFNGFAEQPAFNVKVFIPRDDLNFIGSFSVFPEMNLFVNLKVSNYKTILAMHDVYEIKREATYEFRQTGFGVGTQITVPFSAGNPLYSFISTGVLFNQFTNTSAKQTLIEVFGKPITPITSELEKVDDGSEVLYFLDGGLGIRFTPSLGGAIGIRVEHGPDTKTVIGPTASLFYSF